MIQKTIPGVDIKVDGNMIILSHEHYPKEKNPVIYTQHWEEFKALVDKMLKANMELDKRP